MANRRVTIDTRSITDWDSFHSVFADTFGFPSFYGRNMNAWIDCMSYLDAPGAGMTKVHVAAVEVLEMGLEDSTAFGVRCPEIHPELVDCLAL